MHAAAATQQLIGGLDIYFLNLLHEEMGPSPLVRH